jgi:hypothetical protein
MAQANFEVILMPDANEVIQELRKLKAEHEAALHPQDPETPGYIQNEQVTRKSYRLVAERALDAGLVTPEQLKEHGLAEALEVERPV